MAASTKGQWGHLPPPLKFKNCSFQWRSQDFQTEKDKGAKEFHVGVMAASTKRTMGALAHPLWNLKNVDFSGVARIVRLEGHKGLRHFMPGVMAARTKGTMGALPTPSGI